MRLLFLDIDGVLNNGKPTASGYCTIDYDKVLLLNELLDTLPDVEIVITSAWRYMVLTNQMTLSGFENMLLTYGLKVRGRLHGTTPFDGEHGYDRDGLIRLYIEWSGCTHFVVFDDLDLPVPNLVKTESATGLTREHITKAIQLLSNHE